MQRIVAIGGSETLRVVRNVGLISTRKRRSRLLIFAGVIFLGIAIVAPLVISDSMVITGAYVALIIGFFLFIHGTQQHARWARRPRADEAIDDQLGRLNDRYAVVHYPEIGNGSPDHVVVTPGGLIVLTTRDVQGDVTVEGSRWRQRKVFFMRFFNLGAPSLGNPTLENNGQVATVEQLLEEEALPGDVFGAVLFLSNDVDIKMKDPESEIIHITELYEYCRDIGRDVQLASDDRAQIVAALSVGEDLESSGSRDSRPKKKIKVAG